MNKQKAVYNVTSQYRSYLKLLRKSKYVNNTKILLGITILKFEAFELVSQYSIDKDNHNSIEVDRHRARM